MRTAQRPTLMTMAGDGAGRILRVDSDRTTIGRSKRATIELLENGVSRLHCAIVREKSGRWMIEDLGSTNGTLVNGGRVTRIELSAGDRIQLGPDVVLQFGFYDDAEESLATKLYEAATRDPLTRAHNRRYLMERLSAEVSFATRHSQKLALVIFDIDHFKRVNDEHGHSVGDAVLREVAYAVTQTLRNEDVLARYGGEEFVVLARGLSIKNGALLAERMRKALETRAIEAESKKLRVTVSAGVAALDECALPNGNSLLALADSRLYRAKSAGRNCTIAK
jgi:diguanylate cyclase (GGDEF)-like protein